MVSKDVKEYQKSLAEKWENIDIQDLCEKAVMHSAMSTAYYESARRGAGGWELIYSLKDERVKDQPDVESKVRLAVAKYGLNGIMDTRGVSEELTSELRDIENIMSNAVDPSDSDTIGQIRYDVKTRMEEIIEDYE